MSKIVNGTAFWDICEKRYKAKGFMENNAKTEYGYFWEAVVANLLFENNIKIDKEKGDTKPDFYINYLDKKIHIEAVAVESDQVISFDDCMASNDFESGLSQEIRGCLRLTQILDSKLKQYYNRLNKLTINKDDYYILAINGFKAVNGHEKEDIFDLSGMKYLMEKVLFAKGSTVLNNKNSIVYDGKYLTTPNGGSVQNDYFLDSKTPISGILYSEISKNDFSSLDGKKFRYIQNPYKNDLTDIFQKIEGIEIY